MLLSELSTSYLNPRNQEQLLFSIQSGVSIVKLIAMTIGYMGDFEELFPEHLVIITETKDLLNDHIAYNSDKGTLEFIYVFYVVFLITMVVVFMNLLVSRKKSCVRHNTAKNDSEQLSHVSEKVRSNSDVSI